MLKFRYANYGGIGIQDLRPARSRGCPARTAQEKKHGSQVRYSSQVRYRGIKWSEPNGIQIQASIVFVAESKLAGHVDNHLRLRFQRRSGPLPQSLLINLEIGLRIELAIEQVMPSVRVCIDSIIWYQ